MRQAGIVGAMLLAGGTLVVTIGRADAQSCTPPQVLSTSVVGIKYCANPAFDAVARAQAEKIRQDVRAQRSAGKLVVYASTPISPRGGGVTAVNLEIAASVKTKLEKEYGGAVWVMDPGRYQLPDVDDKSAGGGDYMVMWTAVLAGDDGLARDFDMIHFTGPNDMRAYFACGHDDVSGCLSRWIDARAARDAKFRQDIADNAAARLAFVRYYAMRASATFSTGAHDEWNIAVRVNKKRRLGDQLSMFFDGRPLSPAEMETEIAPGYEVR